jgi:hypothetical protein
MKMLIAILALSSFVAASTIPYVAQAQTPASDSKPAGKKAAKKKEAKKAPARSRAPSAPSAPQPTEDRGTKY